MVGEHTPQSQEVFATAKGRRYILYIRIHVEEYYLSYNVELLNGEENKAQSVLTGPTQIKLRGLIDGD